MSRKLTKKQRGFVRDYVKTGHGTKSALKNYDIKGKDPYSIADSIATENLQKPAIVLAIADMLPDDLLAKRHLELLNLRHKVVVGDELVEVGPDVHAVTKGLDMGYKIKGSYAPEKSVNVNITSEPNERINKLANELRELYGRGSSTSV